MKPLAFLDFDDVICCNRPYGGSDVFSEERPADLWEKLFAPVPVRALLSIVERHDPAFVITTAWLLRMQRDTCETILRNSGLGAVADRLHDHWDAEPTRGRSRREAIEAWLTAHHRGEPYVILDDEVSGISLCGTPHSVGGRFIMCQENVGLHPGHLAHIDAALTTPAPKFQR